MKPKRLLALLMAVVTVVSVFTISASAANTEDTYYTYSWKSNSRYDYTKKDERDSGLSQNSGVHTAL